ncbi:MAG: putative periplasmic serine endoprotease DegP-like precursor [Planctomycetes bacterium ADurb.Bin126]|nr:MAG: putative periplasmic serine endoprotease DegP-like precursor [Planctomycetes bacterium ADurb.Bin126]HOD79781.1 PDZ domain-containing protein [Phycisphaerae bacterium]HQL72789.1 PDZ domain-containing protein [Phycisphaerae bacterium]
MKHWTWIVLVGLLWVQSGFVQAADKPEKAAKPDQPKVEKATPAAKAEEPAKPDKGKAKRSPAVPRKDAPGWLGIRLSPVPAVLGRHLDIEGGLMVANLIKDSPADKAGLDRYDLIVAVDGQAVEGEPGPFARTIQAKKPGDPVRLTIYHRGRKKDVEAMLGTAPTGELAMKYADDDLPPEWMDQFNLRTRMMRLGPDGKMVEVAPQEMMPHIREMLRGAGIPGGGCDMSISIAGDNARVHVSRNDDGKRIDIQQDEQGKITVTRSATGNDAQAEKTKTYESLEALAKDDPEAAKLLKETRANVKVRVHGLGQSEPIAEELRVEIEKKVRDLQEQTERQAREAQDKAREMSEQMHRRFHFQTPRVWVHGFGREGEGFGWDAAGREFKLDPDGKVEVIIRKGGDQVTMTFKNREEFKRKEPKLYEQFRKTLGEK